MIRFAQVSILAADARHGGGKFRPNECSSESDYAAGNPRAENQRGRMHLLGYDVRIDENPRADDSAHDNHGGVENSEARYQTRRVYREGRGGSVAPSSCLLNRVLRGGQIWHGRLLFRRNNSVARENLLQLVNRESFDNVAVAAFDGGRLKQRIVDGLFRHFRDGFEQRRQFFFG